MKLLMTATLTVILALGLMGCKKNPEANAADEGSVAEVVDENDADEGAADLDTSENQGAEEWAGTD